jgi:hypothetical protein
MPEVVDGKTGGAIDSDDYLRRSPSENIAGVKQLTCIPQKGKWT